LWPTTVHGGSPAARVEDQLLIALNEWRQQERQLWPLQPNEQLTALALQQARYLLSLPAIPDDIHRGPGGDTPQDRARAAGWPVYGRPEQIAIGEIGEVGSDVDDAIGFWQGSDIHHRTVMNPAYREVGIAALPHRYGYLFIVVFGARPNVLPTQVDPVHGLLYLSDERFSGAARAGDWLYRTQEVRLFDEEGHPLTGWLAWQPTLPLPDETGDLLVIVYRTASAETLDVIHLDRERVFLPGVGDGAPAEVMATPSGTATRAPALLAPSVATPTPRPVTATPAVVPAATITPDTHPDVLLVYDGRSLALINVSGRSLDLTALVIAGAGDSLPLTRWQTPWLSGSLTAFAAGDCLQVWAWTEAEDLPLPAGCHYRRGVINVAPEARFWAEGAFTLRAGQTVLATCPADGGECAARLPR
jgi:hypothetical protein